MALARATLINDEPTKKCPRVTPGYFDPALLRDMFEAYDEYQDVGNVTTSKLVPRIVKNIKDHVVVRWYRADEERIRKLSLEALKKELRELLLDIDWEITMVREIRNARQLHNEDFRTFYYRVCEKNRLLEDTPSHFDDDALRSHLRASMTDALLIRYEEDNTRLNGIASFTDWLKAVEDVDKRRTKAAKERDDAIAAYLAVQQRAAKRAREDDSAHHGPKKAARNNENVNPHAATSSKNVDPSLKAKKLTDDERQLLDANHGCRRCRKPFVFHYANDNVCEFPPADFPKITEASVAAAKASLTADQRSKLANATKGKGKGKAAPVASTVPAAAPQAPAGRSTAVAAVIADYADERDDEYSSDSEYSDLSHRGVSQPHIYFDCLIEGARTNLPIPTRGLIDNGSFLVLIDEDLVEYVGLRRHRLHEPIPFDTAFATKDTSSSPSRATEYVKLRLLSRDQTYATRPVRAHIVPNLCAPILLGLPFLSRNHITIDHYRRTVIDEIKNYDLVNPLPVTPKVKPMPKQLKRREEFKKIQKQRKLLAEELPELERLRQRGEDIKKDYRPIFDPIPHVDDLPTDVYCEITVKDAASTLTRRTYQSPRKYREAWGI
ncbi:hypothetical protein C8F01DRAFT_1058510, partial [Mycena amicta]